MPKEDLIQSLIKQGIVKKKDNIKIARLCYKYPADVIVNGKRIGTADYNGRKYFFTPIKGKSNSFYKKQQPTPKLTVGDILRQ